MLRYLETLFRNLWLICIPALLLLVSGSVLVLAVKPTYGGMATVWTDRAAYLNVGQENIYVTPAQTHASRFAELVRVGTISRAIVDRLPMAERLTEIEKRRLATDIREELLIESWGEHTVGVMFWHTDSDIPLALVQSAIDQYMEVTAESANFQASEAMAFYQERVTLYEQQLLPRSSNAVKEYLDKHPEVRMNLREDGPIDPDFALLQQQAQRDQEQYERYLQQLDEVQTQSQATSKNQALAFRVIDPPSFVPGSGSVGKKKILMFAGAGLVLALGYAVLYLGLATELDRTLRNAGDVRHRLRLPVLDVVPDFAPHHAVQPGRSGRRKPLPLPWSIRSRSEA